MGKTLKKTVLKKIDQWMFCERCEGSGTIRAEPTTLSLALAHLYDNTFPSEGVWVTGAGSAEANGWYRRRENDELPQSVQCWCWHGYQKDDGCTIIRRPNYWLCRGSSFAYFFRDPTFVDLAQDNELIAPPLPSAKGSYLYQGKPQAKAPAPTLRVVSWSR